jgi:hypothetical protein
MSITFKILKFPGIINNKQNVLNTFDEMNDVISENVINDVKVIMAQNRIKKGDLFAVDNKLRFNEHDYDINVLNDDHSKMKYLFSINKKIEFVDGDYNQDVKFYIK